MATGMPVVSKLVGGVPYVVKDGVTGLLSKYGDVESFAKQIIALLKDEGLWQLYSGSAVQESNRYHWSAINDRIKGIYKCM